MNPLTLLNLLYILLAIMGFEAVLLLLIATLIVIGIVKK